jgi:hypothetical protein
MRGVWAWLRFSFHAAGLLTAIVDAAHADHLIFLSTQLRPIEETQKMRNLILKDFPREVDYITEQPQQFPVRIETEQKKRHSQYRCRRRATRRTQTARATRGLQL